ncbi:MAG: hypothetical protein ACI85I_001165 [Arenicella sp.]|jgi:hypothetical protein
MTRKKQLSISFFILIAYVLIISPFTYGQRFPSEEENIGQLITFGKGGDPSWGDDDFSQTFFFILPHTYTQRFYIRVFDPDTGGKLDENKGDFDTKTRFSVYGGQGVHSNKDAQGFNPTGNYHSGSLLASKTFGVSEQHDGKWHTFGPFNPKEGEISEQFQMKGYVFKIIADGMSGDDGNLYHYFVSTSPDENLPVDGLNGFTYEYSIRMASSSGSIMHIYPYVTENVISIQQHNFDSDGDGSILLYSVSKFREKAKVSGDNVWASSKHPVTQQEHNTSIDIQIVKSKSFNNNMVIYVTNQYNKAVAFFGVPIGGKPKHNAQPNITRLKGG